MSNVENRWMCMIRSPSFEHEVCVHEFPQLPSKMGTFWKSQSFAFPDLLREIHNHIPLSGADGEMANEVDRKDQDNRVFSTTLMDTNRSDDEVRKSSPVYTCPIVCHDILIPPSQLPTCRTLTHLPNEPVQQHHLQSEYFIGKWITEAESQDDDFYQRYISDTPFPIYNNELTIQGGRDQHVECEKTNSGMDSDCSLDQQTVVPDNPAHVNNDKMVGENVKDIHPKRLKKLLRKQRQKQNKLLGKLGLLSKAKDGSK